VIVAPQHSCWLPGKPHADVKRIIVETRAEFALVAEIDLACFRDSSAGQEPDYGRVALRGRAVDGKGIGRRPGEAVIGRPTSAYSCSQTRRRSSARLRSLPCGMTPARSAPNTVRNELVVCCATLRLNELAPQSERAFCVTVKPCSRANGVMLAPAGAYRPMR
jgi:hypothetical protein